MLILTLMTILVALLIVREMKSVNGSTEGANSAPTSAQPVQFNPGISPTGH